MIFVLLPLLDMLTVTWERHQGCWIEFDKGNLWILNYVVCGTFADRGQGPGLHCLL